jgi:uncharacterized protein
MERLRSILPQALLDHARDIYTSFDSAHDWSHIQRVIHNTAILASEEDLEDEELDICLLLALVHDLNDDKCATKIDIEEFLQESIQQQIAKRVAEEQKTISFSKNVPRTSLTAKIVSDADRLDALGSVGIYRCCAYSSARGKSIEQMRQHFFDKLFLLPQHMHTRRAKEIAESRLPIMKLFVSHLDGEIP